jgi:ABC-2 type transport system permease protein
MAKLWAVIRREYVERVRSRWFLIATIFGPVFFGCLLVLPPILAVRTKASPNVSDVRILDATGTDLGDRIAHAIPRGPMSPEPKVVRIPRDSITAAESLATHAVVNGTLTGYLVLDARTLTGDTARYAGRNASSLSDMEVLSAVTKRQVLLNRLLRAHVDSGAAADLADVHLALVSERLTERGRGGSGVLNAFAGMGIALLLYMSILLYGQTVLRSVIEEKNTRVAEVVVASVSTDILLAGKVLGVGSVGITQQIIWFATGYLMAKLRAPILAAFGVPASSVSLPSVPFVSVVTLIFFFLLGYIFYSALFATVGAMVSNEQDAQQAATPIIVMVIIPMIFLQPILLNPSSRTAEILSWLPNSSPIIMPLRMVLTTVSWTEVALTVLGLLFACGEAVWLAARVYRVGLLMYGKRPSFSEVARWIRSA